MRCTEAADAVRTIVVSSPGTSAALHWSHSCAAELASWLARHGAHVEWLAAVRVGQELPPAAPGAAAIVMPAVPAVSRAGADNRHLAIELALTRSLRRAPAHAVVHVGAGARGSPNVCWLAERMGSRPFAVVRSPEVVCHRGDLVHASGARCDEFLDAARCRRCCTVSWWSRARAGAFRSRTDLLAASLLAAAAVFVPTPEDMAPLVAFGVAERSLQVSVDPAVIGARVLAPEPVR